MTWWLCTFKEQATQRWIGAAVLEGRSGQDVQGALDAISRGEGIEGMPANVLVQVEARSLLDDYIFAHLIYRNKLLDRAALEDLLARMEGVFVGKKEDWREFRRVVGL